MSAGRTIFLRLLRSSAGITVFFSFATGLDFVHRYVELFSHFRLQYLAVSLILLLFFAVLRQPVFSALLLLTAVFNASFVVPWYLGGGPGDDPHATRLLLANVYLKNNQYDRLLAYVESEDPDLVLLQEFTPEWEDATRSLHGEYPFRYLRPRRDPFGTAVFSRLPFDSIGHVDSPPLDFPTILATLTVDSRALTLINTHAITPMTDTSYRARNEQLQSVARIAGQARGAVVVTGDFNNSMWNRAYRLLESTAGLVNARRGFGVLPTWPTYLPFAMIPIDHALVSDEVSVIDIESGPHIGSDHLPLSMSITW